MGKKPTSINDNLGRLPVQAIELEEAVLGAVMLESKALTKVGPFLKPEHFYLESHSTIYGAIRSLTAQQHPVDMRTVVQELRNTGKLEIIGGAFYIAELTSKVSSSANVEYHAKVLLECYIKRETARVAMKLQVDAFDDTSDALELLQRSIDDLNALQATSVTRSPESIIKEQWPDRLVKVKPPEEPILIRIDGAEMCSPGNHSMVTGQKKSRKSLFIVHAIDLFFQQNPGAAASEAGIFDTEQGKTHVWKYFDRIKRATGKEITMFRLRGMGYKERREFIEHTITYWPHKMKLIVIDGIRDLVSNINDPDECTELIEWLERLILKFDVHVINILHLNKTDGNARGHLGSELQNKAEASIKITYDKETDLSTVECESSREKGFEPFAFRHGPEGLPELMDLPSKPNSVNDDEQRFRLVNIFTDGPLKYKELLTGMIDNFGMSVKKSRGKIAEFIRIGWIVKSGPDRSPNTVYKLMVSATVTPPPANGHSKTEPVVVDPAQMNLMPMEEDEDLPF